MSIGKPNFGEPRWPASLAVLLALLLYVALPDSLIVGPRWLLPALEAALAVPLTLTRPYRHPKEAKHFRIAAIVLIALVNAANIVSVALLVHHIVKGESARGAQLVSSALSIWLTNVIVFGLWFWELDRGGPGCRAGKQERNPDFLYPQMINPELAPKSWHPRFIDYMYVAFTNAAAFSPTDTMPLTVWAKGLMTAESLVSIVTVVMVAARAVNVLN